MATSTPSTIESLALLVKVSRVPGWCFGPILYTIGVIHARATPKSILELLRYALMTFCLSFPLCIIVFGVNDVYDYESDLRNPRKQGDSLEGGILSPAYHGLVLRAALLSTALIVISSLANSSLIPSSSSQASAPNAAFWQPNVIVLLILSLGWAYSAPPFRFKERPLIDSISNGCLVWLCWALGYVSNGKQLLSFAGAAADESSTKGLVLAFCTTGVHALGAIADVEADVAAGQRTIATAFGSRVAAAFAVICYILGFTTVEAFSFVGIYTLVGSAIALLPVINPSSPDVAHLAFRAIVWVSVVGAAGWIGERAISIVLKKG